MTVDVVDGLVIRQEQPQQCDLCGVIAELRPYGPNGEATCFACMQANEPAAERQFARRLAGVQPERKADSN